MSSLFKRCERQQDQRCEAEATNYLQHSLVYLITKRWHSRGGSDILLFEHDMLSCLTMIVFSIGRTYCKQRLIHTFNKWRMDVFVIIMRKVFYYNNHMFVLLNNMHRFSFTGKIWFILFQREFIYITSAWLVINWKNYS